MRVLALEKWTILFLYGSCSLCAAADDNGDFNSGDVFEEGHSIRKRFASLGYHGYDTATASHRHLRLGRHRRSADRDVIQEEVPDGSRVVLTLSSGKSMVVPLKHIPLVDEETEIVHRMKDGRVTRSVNAALGGNCLASGRVEGGGVASFSLCDGLFGHLSHDGFDYLVHPAAGSGRSRRDVSGLIGGGGSGGESKVHVLWRRSAPHNSSDDTLQIPNDVIYEGGLDDERQHMRRSRSSTGSNELVIELAMFSDAKFVERLEKLYPGREDEFLVNRMAAAQALYSDVDKVGYDFKIKVKLIEYWHVDPEGYHFEEDLGNNIKSFCNYTKTRYFYDLRGLHTGVTEQGDQKIGLGYMGGACKQNTACYVALGVNYNGYVTIAHEIGHTLGLDHPATSKCPEELKTGSFMGGGEGLNFSPCAKWDLDAYLERNYTRCLFEETRTRKTPKSYLNLASALPGQLKSPDELCDLFAGPGYVYFPPGPATGSDVCKHWFCINDDEKSWEYGRIKPLGIPRGFPCGKDMFCAKATVCIPLDSPGVVLVPENLKAIEGKSGWSSWPRKWTKCSRKCGTGVQLRRRQCKKKGVNLKPYCEGEAFKARLCNERPCGEGDDDDALTQSMITQARADEVCKRFVDNGDDWASSIQPKAVILTRTLALVNVSSRSCLLRCERVGEDGKKNDPDAIVPDGTLCHDLAREDYDLKRLEIEPRCVQGRCVEFSGCSKNQAKDSCGICGGDGSRCVTIRIDSSLDVPRATRAVLATIEAKSSDVDVRMKWGSNKRVLLELWSDNGSCIIGKEGQYPEDVYDENTAIKYVGALWTYDRKGAHLTAKGVIKKPVEIRAFRTSDPITEIFIRYAKPKS